MAAHVPLQKIADCRELYLRYGGRGHAKIVAAMRERGWRDFTKRNLYARTRGGRVTPGWPERFGWDREMFTAETLRRRGKKPTGRAAARTILHKPAREQGRNTQHNRRSKPGPAKAPAHRPQASASVRHRLLVSSMTIGRGHNRQKERRRLKEVQSPDLGSRSPGNRLLHGDPTAASHDRRSTIYDHGPEDFHTWLKSLPGIWHWDWRHQLYLYHHLKKVTSGECKRLIICMPPRHGKSELVTVRYAAWRLLQNPAMNVIIGSYNQRLADRFSRKIRRVLCDDAGLTAETQRRGDEDAFTAQAQRRGEAENVGTSPAADKNNGSGSSSQRLCVSAVNGSPFPFTRARPANTVSEWETSLGGGLRAVGVGGGVTGFGANLIVIDDPVKSREQATSQRFRDKVWDWFNDDLYTRLEPGGSIILIQTRWHEDDLAGRLINEMANGGEKWTVVSLPALAERSTDALVRNERRFDANKTMDNSHADEGVRDPGAGEGARVPFDPLGRLPGEALCPERFDTTELAQIRSKMTEMSFAALYQQRPVPAEGGVFKRAWFRSVVDSAPSGLKWKRGYDLAVSLKRSADYTASFRVAYDSEGTLYIEGGFRRRIDFPEQRRYIIERMRLERDTEHGIELAIHGRAVMQELRKMPELRGRRLVGVPVKGDKQERALSWLRLAEEGRVRLVRGHWNRTFIEEACTFPFGTHDDQIDAVSLAVTMHERRPSKLYVF